MKVIVVERYKKPVLKDIGNDLEDMQAIVGGYIESFHMFSDYVCIVVNEEGKSANLPVNRFLWYRHTEYVKPILGTFFLCGFNGENYDDIPEESVSKYIAMFTPNIVKI